MLSPVVENFDYFNYIPKIIKKKVLKEKRHCYSCNKLLKNTFRDDCKSCRKKEPKKTKEPKIKEKSYCICGSEKVQYAKKCMFCSRKKLEKTNWPEDSELAKLIWLKPTSVIARELGVSDNAISHRCKNRNIVKPPRGYWAKQLAHPKGIEPLS